MSVVVAMSSDKTFPFISFLLQLSVTCLDVKYNIECYRTLSQKEFRKEFWKTLNFINCTKKYLQGGEICTT